METVGDCLRKVESAGCIFCKGRVSQIEGFVRNKTLDTEAGVTVIYGLCQECSKTKTSEAVEIKIKAKLAEEKLAEEPKR